MACKIYYGNGGSIQVSVKNMYVGTPQGIGQGVGKRVVNAYIGDANNVARPCFMDRWHTDWNWTYEMRWVLQLHQYFRNYDGGGSLADFYIVNYGLWWGFSSLYLMYDFPSDYSANFLNTNGLFALGVGFPDTSYDPGSFLTFLAEREVFTIPMNAWEDYGGAGEERGCKYFLKFVWDPSQGPMCYLVARVSPSQRLHAGTQIFFDGVW
jgi:hypothetical protein